MVIAKYIAGTTIATLTIAFAMVFVPVVANAAINAPVCVFNTIVQPFNNGGTTLSWKVYDAHTIHINGIGIVNDADSVVVYPTVTTNYTLTATGNGGVDTCTVVAQPTSSYSFNTNNFTGALNQTCSMWVNPDLVVPGGTAILSWNAGNASNVTIDNGVGNVSSTGSRVVANSGVPQTYTMTARWPNGSSRNCNATVYPVGSTRYNNNYTDYGTAYPTYTQPTITYVPINQVPYTGTSDVVYVLTLLAVALGTFTLLYTQRTVFTSALLSFSPTDNEDHEVAIEQSKA